MRHRISPGPLLLRPSELEDGRTRQDLLVRLRGARVVFADHRALRHDFPRLRDVADGELDRWLLRQAAWISRSQAGQAVVNTPVDADFDATREAWRPPRYGRAAVVATDDGPGLLDLKGAGVPSRREPKLRAYSTGLCVLPELLRGIAMKWMVDAVFERAAPDLWTVPVYGILDLGFRMRRPSGRGEAPAALLVRRAHRRPRGGVELPLRGQRQEKVKFEVEALLRSYGLTSTNAGTRLELLGEGGRRRVVYGGQRVRGLSRHHLDNIWRRLGPAPAAIDGINVQMARDVLRPGARAQLVDFGQYELRRRFEPAVASLVRDRPLRCGGVLYPGHPAFIQPDPRLVLPHEDWLPPALGAFVNSLVRSYGDGEIDGREVRLGIESRVERAIARWPR